MNEAEFPDEIWISIFQHIDILTLLNVQRTCKKLYFLAKDPAVLSKISLETIIHKDVYPVVESLTDFFNLDALYIMSHYCFFKGYHSLASRYIEEYFSHGGKQKINSELNLSFISAGTIRFEEHTIPYIAYIHDLYCVHLRIGFYHYTISHISRDQSRFKQLVHKTVLEVDAKYDLNLQEESKLPLPEDYNLVNSGYCGSNRCNAPNEISIDYTFFNILRTRQRVKYDEFDMEFITREWQERTGGSTDQVDLEMGESDIVDV